jgi:hypothetical protein
MTNRHLGIVRRLANPSFLGISWVCGRYTQYSDRGTGIRGVDTTRMLTAEGPMAGRSGVDLLPCVIIFPPAAHE